ncbi:MAG: hypothetical protein ABSB71_08090 [Candidatus Bathyarchaeia archaeon]|jgi:hypothetical protein
MSRTWAYLTPTEHEKYIRKAESLNISEGELTQRLIHLYLNTQTNTMHPTACLNCQYYQVATSNLIQALKKFSDFFIVIQPEKPKRSYAPSASK